MNARSSSSRRSRALPRWGAAAAALWMSFQVAACGSPTDPGVDRLDPDTPRITEVTGLTPGGNATIVGNSLQDITSVTIDGQTVNFTPTSATRGTFPVPELNSCEADGRKVEIVTNTGLTSNSRMEISSTLHLEVGESRILSAEDLACLQIGRGLEAYVMTVANFDTDPGNDRNPFRLYVRGTGNMQPAAAAMSAGLGLAPHVHHDHETKSPAEVVSQAGTPSDGPFADYANAAVGDTLDFVDWRGGHEVWTATEKEDVPTRKGVVVAVEGDQMVVALLRSGSAQRFVNDPEQRRKIQDAALITSEVALPALRALIHPAFEVPKGAGGRMITFLDDLPFATAGTVSLEDLRTNEHRWASGMFTGVLNAQRAVTTSAETIANIMVHEIGHLGDAWSPRVQGGSARVSAGWHSEAFAVAVEDAAHRIRRGGLRGIERPEPQVAHSGVLLGAGKQSPWGTPTGGRDHGWYGRGAEILLYAQSRFLEGEAWRLHDALVANDVAAEAPTHEERLKSWGIETVASELGMCPRELLEQSMMANVTQNFVPDDVAAARGLPRTGTWTGTVSDVDGWIRAEHMADYRFDRVRDYDIDVSVPRGGYMMRFIAGARDRGLSFEMSENDLTDQEKVRITRIK